MNVTYDGGKAVECIRMVWTRRIVSTEAKLDYNEG